MIYRLNNIIIYPYSIGEMTEIIKMPVNHPNTNLQLTDDTDVDICEICYGNCKCDKYKCKECDNSICISCAESWSKMSSKNIEEQYSVKCPFCRTLTKYNYDDLTNEEYKVFYLNLRKRLTNIKKPLLEQERFCEKYTNDLQHICYWISRMNEDSKLKCEKKFYDGLYTDVKKIIHNKYEVLDGSKLHRDYEKAIDEIEDLKDNKRLYDSCKAYNETIKNKLLKQQSELEKQTEMMRNMERQNTLLIQQNKELFNKVNDIFNIVNNKNEIRKPQQVIKTIATNIKEIVDKKPELSINIVFDRAI